MRSRTVKSEVIPEDKSLVNVLYICEVNNCGYNCEYPNKSQSNSESTNIYRRGNLTRDNIMKIKINY
jgi:hypothetical protein